MLKQLLGFSLEEMCEAPMNEKFRNASAAEQWEMIRPPTPEKSFRYYFIGRYGYDAWEKFQWIKWLGKQEITNI